jgi:Cu/Ag efflux protein CusF
MADDSNKRKEVSAMSVIRSILVAVVGLFLALGAPVQLLAASHQAAGQEQKAEKAAAPTTRRHVGTVKAVDAGAGTLTVAEKAGEATVAVSEKTTVRKGKGSLKLSDLKPGDEVTVLYVKEGEKDVARSVTVKAK